MKKIGILILLLMSLSSASNAAAYWMEIQGSGKVNEPVIIRLIYGNIDEAGIRHRHTGKELQLTGDFKMSISDENGRRTQLALQQRTDCWEATFVPAKTGTYRITGINDTHPVIDRSKIGGENVRPIDYLCGVYTVGSDQISTKPIQLLDIITSPKGKMISIKAFKQNNPVVSGTKLRVFNPENWEKELVTDDKAEASFMPTMKGMYIIRQDWVDPQSGNYKGVAYTSIRHRCNYCLFIE